VGPRPRPDPGDHRSSPASGRFRGTATPGTHPPSTSHRPAVVSGRRRARSSRPRPTAARRLPCPWRAPVAMPTPPPQLRLLPCSAAATPARPAAYATTRPCAPLAPAVPHEVAERCVPPPFGNDSRRRTEDRSPPSSTSGRRGDRMSSNAPSADVVPARRPEHARRWSSRAPSCCRARPPDRSNLPLHRSRAVSTRPHPTSAQATDTRRDERRPRSGPTPVRHPRTRPPARPFRTAWSAGAPRRLPAARPARTGAADRTTPLPSPQPPDRSPTTRAATVARPDDRNLRVVTAAHSAVNCRYLDGTTRLVALDGAVRHLLLAPLTERGSCRHSRPPGEARGGRSDLCHDNDEADLVNR